MSAGARILDGKATAALVRADVRARALQLAQRGRAPGLTVILVGDDPASHVYVRNKDKAAHEAGFVVRTLRLAATASQAEVETVVAAQNADESVDGILVQLPLPLGIDAERIIQRIDPAKDVDGLTAHNVALLALGRPGLRPCTPLGCIELLDRHAIALEGREVVVVGRSQLVGKPFAALALLRNATVTIAHSRTVDLAGVCARADVLVAAVGRPRLVRGDWVKPGATVLDVGINRLDDGTLAGDVDFEAARSRAAWITPVPGGVGPMTIAMLLANTLHSAERSLAPTFTPQSPVASAPKAAQR
jgi:methylenetetrahydrofolate dehydrogenase (NADP+)/methenyltetrahydrofolate cyclohydrolase